MEINLRKSRKLEAKINTYVEAMDLKTAIKVRALASTEERAAALASARINYLGDLGIQRALIKARFQIRGQISTANQNVGINALIGKREEITALLSKSNAGVDTLDVAELEDLASTKAKSLSNGGDSRAYGESTVTITVPVSTNEDLKAFKSLASDLKKELEDIEDQLSQKNLGATITLDNDTVALLQSVGLL